MEISTACEKTRKFANKKHQNDWIFVYLAWPFGTQINFRVLFRKAWKHHGVLVSTHLFIDYLGATDGELSALVRALVDRVDVVWFCCDQRKKPVASLIYEWNLTEYLHKPYLVTDLERSND